MPDPGNLYGPVHKERPATNQGKKKRLARQQRADAKKSK